MPAVGEHLEPLVEGGNLGLEEDVPFFEEAEATLFGGGVVAVPPCLDGPGDGEWGACPLQGPHMLAEGGAFCALHVLVLHVVGVSPESLLEGGLAEPGVSLLGDDGQVRGRLRLGGRHLRLVDHPWS